MLIVQMVRKRDILYFGFVFLIANKRRVDIESTDQIHILSCLVYIRTINLDSSKLRKEKLHVIYLLRERNKKNEIERKRKSSRFEYCFMFIVIIQLVFTLNKMKTKKKSRLKIEDLIILGVPQTKICSKSLLWSQKHKMCVWPVQSDCKFNFYNDNLFKKTYIF